MSWSNVFGSPVPRGADPAASPVALLRSKRMVLAIGALGAAFLLLYAPVVAELARTWRAHDRLEGYLIPVISLYLIWMKRGVLRRLRIEPVPLWGTMVLVSACMLLILGEAGGVQVLREISLIAALAGIVLMLFGAGFLKALALPLLYLTFMLSFAVDLVAPLHWPFQLLTARMAVDLLQMLGFAALLDRQYIVLPHITMEVAQVCSGANYLVSIVAIGLPLAYLTLRSWWARLSLILSGFAIAIAANWVRVFIIGALAYTTGEMTHGPFHVFQGMFVAWIGYLALFGGAWVLVKLEERFPPPTSMPTRHADSHGPSTDQGARSVDGWARLWLGAAVVLVVCSIYLGSYDREPVHPRRDFGTFPISIGDWVGKRADSQHDTVRVAGADRELVRSYQDARGWTVRVYVAYFASQRQGKELVSDKTAAFHEDAQIVDYRIGPAQVVPVNRGRRLVDKGNRDAVFWYDIDGRVIANRYKAKWATTLGALWNGRTNGSVVVLTAEAPAGGVEKAREVEEAFLAEFLPVLRSYLP